LSIESIDPTVILEGITLTAMDEEVSYQWLDCLNNHEEIPGETEQSFTPTQNGSYAVLLTSSLCSEISECIDINSLNLSDLSTNEFTIYPNPTKDLIHIEKISSEEVQIILRDNQGRILISKTTSDIKTSIDLSQYSEGVYHITIQQGDFLHRKSIMKLQ
jgi:hypothetical protein